MQLARKSALGLGLVMVMFASTIPVSNAHAVTAKQVALLSCILAITPYLINYQTRQPQKEPRFDKSQLFYGSFKKKIKHLHYFVSDILFGWPYKDKKVVVKKDIFGKENLDIQSTQLPGGGLGNAESVAYSLGKALMFPATVLAYCSMWAAGLEWWTNPSLKAPDEENALSRLALLPAISK